MMPRPLFLCALFLSLTLTACDGSSNTGDDEDPRSLVLLLNNLQPLPNGFHYEGWAVLTTSAGLVNASVGKFNLDDTGGLVDLGGAPIPGDALETNVELERAASFFITIEPAGDTNQTPSQTPLLGGDFTDGRATLTTDHGRAISESLLLATGAFILATPTDGPDTNEQSGLWFINLTGGAPARGLRLPDLPAGWIYQGWLSIDGVTVSTGTFTDVSRMDDSAPYSGPMEGFSVPGEDFLVNAPPGLNFPLSLAGSVVIVSMEPSPDTDAGRFPLDLLTGSAPADATDNVTYTLTNNLSAFPTGTARIRQ